LVGGSMAKASWQQSDKAAAIRKQKLRKTFMYPFYCDFITFDSTQR
jgi:hypothetical protein